MSLLGERLRQVREARGISPLQVEIETRIRANVIQALEEGDFESLPPEPFLRGLIRSYSNYLGVDSQEMLDLYVADITPALPVPTPPHPLAPKKPATPPPPPQNIPEPTRASTPTAPAPASVAEPAPSKPIPPSMPPPPAPPETLAPPEKLERDQPADENAAAPAFLAHITRRGIPLPVVVLISIAVILSCLAATLVFVTKVGPAFVSVTGSGTTTPTRAPATWTPTLQPGAPSTSIPTLAVTAAPFATFPGNPTATLIAAPRRTPEATVGLNLDVDVTQTITISVGIDGAMVFGGAMQPGTTRSWSAQDSLYVRVENVRGATLSLNGNPKWFGARNFAELTALERMWTVNDKGMPISVPPVAPLTATPPASTSSTLPVNSTPTATLTPFS